MPETPPSSIGEFAIGESQVGGPEPFGPSSAIGGFAIGVSPIGGPALGPWPPFTPTTIQNILPAYLYVEYQDDDEVRAFFTAYNIYAQAYLDYFNNLNLPIYTGGNIVAGLLDWVAASPLYGLYRPGLPTPGTPSIGPINTTPLNTLPLNGYVPGINGIYTTANDDIFKRVITWYAYRGDGKVFTPQWLKRRINRFLNGVNGTDVNPNVPYNISVKPTGFKRWTITLPNTTIASILKTAVQDGVLELPFQISWTINLE